MNKELFYPALFQPEENGSYSIFFPDIPGCNTTGNTIEHAYEMAFDALGIVLSYMEDNNEAFPIASDPATFDLTERQFVVIIRFNMLEYKKKHSSKAVKKTLSIPEWLNEEALRQNINFSQVLQEALMQKLNVTNITKTNI